MAQVMRFTLALTMASGVAVAASFQQRVESPVLFARTELVTLTVTVVDRDGGLVAGLRADDFTVYDNGEPQAIQFFSSEDVPAAIGLIVDSSGSMRGRRTYLEAATAAFGMGRHSLDEFFALHFNETIWPAAVSVSPPQGLTALYDAVDRGLSELQRGTRDRKALILVSDGGDNASEQRLDAVLDRARHDNALIYSVTVFDPDNRDARPQVLKTLTRETGGRAFTAKNVEDVSGAVTRIVQEVRAGYTIGFAPADMDSGGYRPIRVVVDTIHHRGLIARTRAGYYAGPSPAPVK